MPPKPVEIYQGSDWPTYRWSVAQAFDTLDRIRDPCLQMPVMMGSVPVGADQPRYMKFPMRKIADMFGYIIELCDDLMVELDTIQADLSGAMKGNPAHAWLAFEMRLHLLICAPARSRKPPP